MTHISTPDRMLTEPVPRTGGKVLARTYASAEAAGRAAYSGWLNDHGAMTDCGLKQLTDAVARAAVEAVADENGEQAAAPHREVARIREAELLDRLGPCRNSACRLHKAHSGPCAPPRKTT